MGSVSPMGTQGTPCPVLRVLLRVPGCTGHFCVPNGDTALGERRTRLCTRCPRATPRSQDTSPHLSSPQTMPGRSATQRSHKMHHSCGSVGYPHRGKLCDCALVSCPPSLLASQCSSDTARRRVQAVRLRQVIGHRCLQSVGAQSRYRFRPSPPNSSARRNGASTLYSNAQLMRCASVFSNLPTYG